MIHFLPQTASSLPLSLLLLISIFGFMIPSDCQLFYCPVPGSDTVQYSNLNSSVNLLLDSLSSNASSHTFYNESSNGIYGLFLCRGDISSKDCHSCVGDASKRIKLVCPSRTNAIIWFDECMLRYSVQNFFGTLEMPPSMLMLMWNTQNKTSPDNPDTDARALLFDIIAKAKDADSMFKADMRNPDNPIYGLAQCTTDILKLDCEKCLNF